MSSGRSAVRGKRAPGRFATAILVGLAAASPAANPAGNDPSPAPVKSTAKAYLNDVFDRYHKTFYVYDDFVSGGNHFEERGVLSNPGEEQSVPPMDENCSTRPHSGINCIQCGLTKDVDWGGWMFLACVFREGDQEPRVNWGTGPDGGYDLTGATKLTFWARGERGGEKVKFFLGGVGRNPLSGKPNKPCPESLPQMSTDYIELSKDWKPYSISLKNKDLHRVLLGFAWMTKASINDHKDITFYLDDIEFDKPRPEEPRFLLSYECIHSSNDFDIVMRNTAFTYDNAVALLAFLAAGDTNRARLIADAMVYAQNHDRYFVDGRIRNAYEAGDLTVPPGWTPKGRTGTARIPGWWDSAQEKWLEDRMTVGTYAGNMAWTMLGLLAYYEMQGGDSYLRAAERMGEWVEANCRDENGHGGYTAGFEGWEPDQTKLTYKSTEHNIGLYAAFNRLYLITGEPKWRERAVRAGRLVASMWDAREGKFWTGTKADGVTIFREVIPLDVQAWSVLALREDAPPCLKALDYAESQLMVGEGFDFNQDTDGVWYEGTAHMATAFSFVHDTRRRDSILAFLHERQDSSGGLTAADRDDISTGFSLPTEEAWLYYPRLHVGATGWLVLAERARNPFWLGSHKRQPYLASTATGPSAPLR